MSKIELPKIYDASKVEDGIYKDWEESGFFNPDTLDAKGPSFTIAMPPPNATGILHTGHATMLAIEDLMIRYHRMKGDRTLWIPGTDHASIATQTKVEKIIAEEGLTRHKLGREDFLLRVDAFVEDSRNTIKNQVRKMGSSCDWSRERFTLDAGLSTAVNTAFEKMYKDGLIVRGDRVVNWCPRCHSTLADDEVEHIEQKAKFYTFKYALDFPFAIATTRPETKIGDTAIAVNPRDARYKKYIGQEFKIDFVGVPLKLKVIGDRNVDMEFGTGALGVTPAHSHTDYQMAIENELEIIKVIDKEGNIEDGFGEYSGKGVLQAREMIVKNLKKAKLLEKEEEIDNKLSICYRCQSPIEPLPSLQWFVSVDKPFKLRDKSKLKWDKDEATIKELAIHVVREGLIKIIPERFEKTYFHWMENLHDWCISRQIWYGHQIPVWYKGQEIHVGSIAPRGDGWKRDEDTLDTWFSSALWTFSTLGWPEQTKDLELFHPTSVMETGYDILFFWVARMIIMTTYCLNDIPFETVYLHGLVRDEEGKKMSKSLGNAMDPLDLIKKYGTDALRLSMLIGVTPGNDFKLFDEKVAGYRNFVNKLWNISRFVLTIVQEPRLIEDVPETKTLSDKWIILRLHETIEEVSKNLDQQQLSTAGEILQQFTWNDFADWYLEIYKVESQKSKNKEGILLYVLQNILKLWHPFCPFVTEEIWKKLGADKMIMISPWPEFLTERDEEIAQDFELMQNIIGAIRNLRSENKIGPAKMLNVTFIVQKDKDIIEDQKEVIRKLARIEELNILESGDKPANSVSTVIGSVEIYIDLTGIIDIEAEKERLNREISESEKYTKSLESKLANKQFVDNAPEAVVSGEKEKLQNSQDKLTKLRDQLNNLK